MIILSEETEALARRLAGSQRLTVEQTIRAALEEQARNEGTDLKSQDRDQSPAAVEERRARTDRLVAVFATTPVLDPRSPHEIMDDLNTP